jgi:hypothetical protein
MNFAVLGRLVLGAVNFPGAESTKIFVVNFMVLGLVEIGGLLVS